MIKLLNKKLFLVFALATLAIGATGAYFSDHEQLTGNTFTSGTLDLVVASDSTEPVTLENMKPGDTVTKEIYFSNDGTIDIGSLKLSLSNITDDGGLLGAIDASIRYSADTSDESMTFDLGTVKANEVSSKELIETDSAQFLAGRQGKIEITFTLPSDAGNEYQGLNSNFDIEIDAEQIH